MKQVFLWVLVPIFFVVGTISIVALREHRRDIAFQRSGDSGRTTVSFGWAHGSVNVDLDEERASGESRVAFREAVKDDFAWFVTQFPPQERQ